MDDDDFDFDGEGAWETVGKPRRAKERKEQKAMTVAGKGHVTPVRKGSPGGGGGGARPTPGRKGAPVTNWRVAKKKADTNAMQKRVLLKSVQIKNPSTCARHAANTGRTPNARAGRGGNQRKGAEARQQPNFNTFEGYDNDFPDLPCGPLGEAGDFEQAGEDEMRAYEEPPPALYDSNGRDMTAQMIQLLNSQFAGLNIVESPTWNEQTSSPGMYFQQQQQQQLQQQVACDPRQYAVQTEGQNGVSYGTGAQLHGALPNMAYVDFGPFQAQMGMNSQNNPTDPAFNHQQIPPTVSVQQETSQYFQEDIERTEMGQLAPNVVEEEAPPLAQDCEAGERNNLDGDHAACLTKDTAPGPNLHKECTRNETEEELNSTGVSKQSGYSKNGAGHSNNFAKECVRGVAEKVAVPTKLNNLDGVHAGDPKKDITFGKNDLRECDQKGDIKEGEDFTQITLQGAKKVLKQNTREHNSTAQVKGNKKLEKKIRNNAKDDGKTEAPKKDVPMNKRGDAGEELKVDRHPEQTMEKPKKSVKLDQAPAPQREAAPSKGDVSRTRKDEDAGERTGMIQAETSVGEITDWSTETKKGGTSANKNNNCQETTSNVESGVGKDLKEHKDKGDIFQKDAKNTDPVAPSNTRDWTELRASKQVIALDKKAKEGASDRNMKPPTPGEQTHKKRLEREGVFDDSEATDEMMKKGHPNVNCDRKREAERSGAVKEDLPDVVKDDKDTGAACEERNEAVESVAAGRQSDQNKREDDDDITGEVGDGEEDVTKKRKKKKKKSKKQKETTEAKQITYGDVIEYVMGELKRIYSGTDMDKMSPVTKITDEPLPDGLSRQVAELRNLSHSYTSFWHRYDKDRESRRELCDNDLSLSDSSPDTSWVTDEIPQCPGVKKGEVSVMSFREQLRVYARLSHLLEVATNPPLGSSRSLHEWLPQQESSHCVAAASRVATASVQTSPGRIGDQLSVLEVDENGNEARLMSTEGNQSANDSEAIVVSTTEIRDPPAIDLEAGQSLQQTTTSDEPEASFSTFLRTTLSFLHSDLTYAEPKDASGPDTTGYDAYQSILDEVRARARQSSDLGDLCRFLQQRIQNVEDGLERDYGSQAQTNGNRAAPPPLPPRPLEHGDVKMSRPASDAAIGDHDDGGLDDEELVKRGWMDKALAETLTNPADNVSPVEETDREMRSRKFRGLAYWWMP